MATINETTIFPSPSLLSTTLHHIHHTIQPTLSKQLSSTPPSYILSLVLLITLPLAYRILSTGKRYPIINYQSHELTYENAKKRFVKDAKGIIDEGFKKVQGPFYAVTEYGPKMFLGPEYIEHINKEKALDLMTWSRTEQLSHLPGFELFRGSDVEDMLESAVRIKLTQNLPKFTDSLVEEMSFCLMRWNNDGQWHTTHLRGDVLQWVAQLSSTVFLPMLRHDPEWLKISIMFTVELFEALRAVRAYPWFLQRLVCMYLPVCRNLQKNYAAARRLIRPIVEQREKEAREAAASGEAPPKHNDALAWVQECSRGEKYDPERSQLGLTMAAIHTTADLLTECVYKLCEYPDIVPTLREEAERVLGQHGWNKVALYELKHLDSFMKEVQRVKPIGMTTMNRGAKKDVELPGGIKVKKGELIGVSSHLMWDESIYPQPEKFDPFRFVKQREEPGKEFKSHFVSTSVDFTAFSHGKHACPGRFFAANETKIALVKLITDYDLKMDKPAVPTVYGAGMTADPTAMVHYRKRV